MLGQSGLPGDWENHLTSWLHNLIGHNCLFQRVLCLVRILLGSGKPCRLRSGHRKEKNIWRVEANIFYNLANLSPRRTANRFSTPNSTTFYRWLKMGRDDEVYMYSQKVRNKSRAMFHILGEQWTANWRLHRPKSSLPSNLFQLTSSDRKRER